MRVHETTAATEQRRNVEFKFGPDKQLPPDASSLEWTVHGLLG